MVNKLVNIQKAVAFAEETGDEATCCFALPWNLFLCIRCETCARALSLSLSLSLWLQVGSRVAETAEQDTQHTPNTQVDFLQSSNVVIFWSGAAIY